MDENIFGGTPVGPEEPQNEEINEVNEENAVNEAENTDFVSEEISETIHEPDRSGEYHYNRTQYQNIQGASEQENNAPSQSYNPSYTQNTSYGSQQQPYQGYNQSTGNQHSYGNNPYANNGANGYNQPYNPFAHTVPHPKKKNAGLKVFTGIIVAIVVLVAVLMVALFAGDGITDSGKNNSLSGNKENSGQIDNVEDITASESSNAMGDAVTVANVAKPFNVGILVYSKNQLYTEGSGVIIQEDDDGKYTYIVTCAHVVNYNGVSLSVLMEDGTEYPADLVGMDTRTDLAVVRIEASGLPAAVIADSDKLVVGQKIYAVGNPGGSEFFGSVTDGIISAIGRPVSSGTGYEMECIQHTSAINPGNSGGALVNGQGHLVGINSMKIASTEYEGMGFAVPSSVMVDVFNSIIENGYVAGRAKLGIQYATPSNYSQTYAMYVQMKGLPTGTIVVASVSEDSDLFNKDVKEGDMIIAVNGKEMTHSDMLADMIEDMSAGDTLTLTIVRVNTDDWSQTERDVTVKLVEDTGSSGAQTPENNDNSGSGSTPYGDDYQDWYEFFKDFYGY